MKLALGCVALATIALGAAACTADPEPSVSPSPSPMTTSVSPTPSVSVAPTPSPSPAPEPSPSEFQSFPPPPDGETEEQAAIREGWEAYNVTKHQFLRDASLTDLTATQYVTTGDEANRIIDEIQVTRDANVRVEGDLLFREVRLEGITAEEDGVRHAVITYCFDPAHQRVVDIDTGEPYPDPRTATLEVRDTLHEGKDGQWRVALHENREVPC